MKIKLNEDTNLTLIKNWKLTLNMEELYGVSGTIEITVDDLQRDVRAENTFDEFSSWYIMLPQDEKNSRRIDLSPTQIPDYIEKYIKNKKNVDAFEKVRPYLQKYMDDEQNQNLDN